MKLLIALVVLVVPQVLCGKSAITYDLNGGRFGDCLSALSKAQWYAFKYKLDFIYKPFEYSDQLAVHYQEKVYSPELLNNYSKIVKVKTEEDIIKHKDEDTILFVSNFYSITPDLYDYRFADKIWEKEIKKALLPIGRPEKHQATHTVTVALHVRKGGGFDQPLSTDGAQKENNKEKFADEKWPSKFPTDEYYIESVKKIIKFIPADQMIEIHLFTDDPNPGKLANKYHEALQEPRITFKFREKGNAHNKNVVEDYFGMAECDYLVRSSSLLAKAAQMIGNHKAILYPGHGYWDGTKPVIDLIYLVFNERT